MTDPPPCKRPRLNNNLDENNNDAASSVSSKGGSITSAHSLNDERLLSIFSELDIETFCRLTMTDSKRFKAIAEQAFVQRFEHFEFEIESYSTNTIRCVLQQFGHLMKSMDTFNFEPTWKSWLSQLIANKCKDSMEKLFLHNMTIDSDAMKPLISRLKVLELNCCQFIGNTKDLLTNCPQLETFYFDSVANANFVAQKFPKLPTLAFDGRESKTLSRLLLLNPQIIKLRVICLPDDSIISLIVSLLSNIESLSITPGLTSRTPNIQTSVGLLKLTKLKMLKHLSIDAGAIKYSKSVRLLVTALSFRKVNLESLHLSNFSIRSMDIKSIKQIKTLKTLSLHDVEMANVKDFVGLTKKLPLLEELHLQFEYHAVQISPVDIQNMIQFAGKLTYLGISQVRNFKIEQNVYVSLLEVVRSRDEAVKLTINICGCISTNGSNVPKNIQLRNQSLLNIKFESWDCNCIHCNAD